MKQILVASLLLIFVHSEAQVADEKFSFVVFGDMPYSLPQDYIRFERLIKVANQQNQLFNVHVGDIKSSSTLCSEEYFQKIINYFNTFKKPLIYTPGDNEWTDCGKVKAGSYQPEERLDVIRRMFFVNDLSFGEEKLRTVPQSQNPLFSRFVENRIWTKSKITFATLHVVGSNNNFLPDSNDFNREFFERDKANIAWLNEIFNQSKKNDNQAIFLFMQADMFHPDKKGGGFDLLLKELKRLVIDFNKTVVLINGDSHEFLVDKPLKSDASDKVLANFTRIQVFGEEDIHAVKIVVDPSASASFQVEQILIPGN